MSELNLNSEILKVKNLVDLANNSQIGDKKAFALLACKEIEKIKLFETLSILVNETITLLEKLEKITEQKNL